MRNETEYTFGHFFKEMRLKTGLSLRKFCLQKGLDAGNISKIERGFFVPQSRSILEKYAGHLGITENSEEWCNFFDYAAASSGKIPQDVMNDEELIKKLPVVFRTLRSSKLTPEDLQKLAEEMRHI